MSPCLTPTICYRAPGSENRGYLIKLLLISGSKIWILPLNFCEIDEYFALIFSSFQINVVLIFLRRLTFEWMPWEELPNMTLSSFLPGHLSSICLPFCRDIGTLYSGCLGKCFEGKYGLWKVSSPLYGFSCSGILAPQVLVRPADRGLFICLFVFT